MPSVSIVLPTFNGEKYLSKSIESIISQSFTDWELVIVNDCSTDTTPMIAEKYAAIDSRIKVIHNKDNMKLPHSLNIGFDSSTGKYLTWTSDDNIYLPEAIGKMYDYLSSNTNAYMVCAQMEVIDENDKTLYKSCEYDSIYMYRDNHVGACFMYKREVLEQVGKYDIDYFCVEDYEYWLRILKLYGSIEYIPEVLYKYRLHEKSLTSTKKTIIKKQLAKLRNNYTQYIQKQLDGHPDLLWQIYLEFMEAEYWEPIESTDFCFPAECKYDNYPDKKYKIIAFGSGFYGKKMYDIFGNKIAYYVDNDLSKVGTIINGVEVLSFDNMKKIINEDFIIVISVSKYNSYSIAHQLVESGITNYCTFEKYCLNNKIDFI